LELFGPPVQRPARQSYFVESKETFARGKIMAKKSPQKPRLTLVEPPASGPEPPRKLGERGRKLWDDLLDENDIGDSSGITSVMHICLAEDRLEAVERQIAEDGEVVMTRAGPKEHPLLKIELQLRSFIVRSLQRLGLQVPSIGRPPGSHRGYTS
jgi:hypothetical protein